MAKRYRQAHRARRNSRANLPAVLIFVVLLMGAAVALGIWAARTWGQDDSAPGETASPAPQSSGTSQPAESAGSSAQPAEAPTPAPTPSPTPEPTPPPIPDDGSDGYLSSGVYIWQNKAFELFYGSTDAAAAYAQAISGYQQQLPGTTVYNMVVPNHSEFGLPERIRNDMGCTSQRENLSDVFANYTEGSQVIPVDIYDALDYHKDQYLYFNTDTHWAPLGAYWAYTAFCEAAGQTAAPLSDFTVSTVEDFTGYLYVATGESCLAENPDHIDLYEPGFDYTIELSYDGVSFTELSGMYAPDEGMGYSMVLWGDNPLVRVTNHDDASGRKLLLVKDSYGNAIAPFLAANYSEVHVADFRSFPGKLPAYCQENGITDVLFFNNVMSANTYSQIETMNGLF